MRALPLSVAAGGALLMALGCSGGNTAAPSAPTGTAAIPPSAPTYDFTPGADSLVAMFTLTIDPATMSSTVEPIVGRTAQTQPPQAISYDLDIANFLKPDSFEVTAISRDVDGNVVVDYNHRHPFRAPDFNAPISGQNRADLGYTGRLMILADGDSETYFGGSVDLDPSLVVNPDGYYNTGDLLASTGHTNNTFPYMLLADDGKDNRIDGPTGAAISNGGNPHGSYSATDGWQRANAGTGTGWTGFDYIHAGQGSTNSFTLNAATLAAGPTAIDIAVLIKYTDPRGRGGRTLRFPPIAPLVTDFAYRLPYAALDASRVEITATDLEIDDAPAGDTASVTFEVRDWDANATAAAGADLSVETDVTLVEPGAPGAPTAMIDAPFLTATPVVVVPSGTNSGEPGDEIPFGGTLTNSLATAAPGTHYACLRLIDPSDATTDSNYHFGVDPNTIVPSPSRSLAERTFQIIPIDVIQGLEPPIITAVNPTGVAGCASSNVTFIPTFTNTVDTWSWDFGGGAAPNTSAVEQPAVVLSATPTSFNGTVTATNAAGSSAPFPFSFSVANPWSIQTVDQGTTTVKALRIATAVYGGKPVIAAMELGPASSPTSARVMLSFATVAAPQTAADWTTYALPSMAYSFTNFGTSVDLLVDGGRLFCSFKDTSVDDLRIGVSGVVEPVVPTLTDWTYHTVDNSSTDVGRDNVMVLHNGQICIGYLDATVPSPPSDAGVKLARALVAVPSTPADWTLHTIDTVGNTGYFSGMVSHDDGGGARLWACYLDVVPIDLKVARALTIAPAASGDWSTYAVDPTVDSGRWNAITSFAVAGSPRLAMSYGGFNSSFTKVAISTVPSPTSDAEWRKITLATDPTGFTSGFPWGTDVAVSNGRVVVVWNHYQSSDSDLGFAHANIEDPLTAADFAISFPDTGVHEGYYPQVQPLPGGTLGIAYREGWNTINTVGSTRWLNRNCGF